MGKILFGQHALAPYFLIYILKKSHWKICVSIQTLSELKFCWSISCYTAHVCLIRPWCLCPIWEFLFGGGYPDNQDWGDGIVGATVYELEPLFFCFESPYIQAYSKRRNFFSLENQLDVFTKFLNVGMFHIIWIKYLRSPLSTVPYK